LLWKSIHKTYNAAAAAAAAARLDGLFCMLEGSGQGRKVLLCLRPHNGNGTARGWFMARRGVTYSFVSSLAYIK
jgi:hypothetical protein